VQRVSWSYYEVLPNLGAAVTLGLGILGLLSPDTAAKLVALKPLGRLGTSELRATFGGLFAAMGLWVLVTQAPAAKVLLGVGWLGAAVGRVISVIVDRSVSVRNLGAVAFEGAIAAFLLLGGG